MKKCFLALVSAAARLRTRLSLLFWPYEHYDADIDIRAAFPSDQIVDFADAPEVRKVRLLRRHRKTGTWEGYMPCTISQDVSGVSPSALAVGYDWVPLPQEMMEPTAA